MLHPGNSLVLHLNRFFPCSLPVTLWPPWFWRVIPPKVERQQIINGWVRSFDLEGSSGYKLSDSIQLGEVLPHIPLLAALICLLVPGTERALDFNFSCFPLARWHAFAVSIALFSLAYSSAWVYTLRALWSSVWLKLLISPSIFSDHSNSPSRTRVVFSVCGSFMVIQGGLMLLSGHEYYIAASDVRTACERVLGPHSTLAPLRHGNHEQLWIWSVRRMHGKCAWCALQCKNVEQLCTSNMLLFSVRRVPPYFSYKLEKIYRVGAGGSVNLTCVAVGFPMPRVFWKKSDDGENKL